jgi:chromatin segregation and condensation protein Rec8/ScpA/Scc1 (kleisin family)
VVSRRQEGRERPAHLEAEVFDLMTAWIERYRRQAEERYRRLDEVLASLTDAPELSVDPGPPRAGAAP